MARRAGFKVIGCITGTNAWPASAPTNAPNRSNGKPSAKTTRRGVRRAVSTATSSRPTAPGSSASSWTNRCRPRGAPRSPRSTTSSLWRRRAGRCHRRTVARHPRRRLARRRGGAAARALRGQRREAAPQLLKPDEELATDWRNGACPYKNPVRGPRRGRQGRHHQALHGAPQPRGARVVALEKPTETERGQWYFQRYVQHLPTAGEIVLFDRSWYNRAGVERVMGFCNRPASTTSSCASAPEFERATWCSSGIHLIKFWFSVSRAEQRRRFKEREAHPLKQWKLAPSTMASLDKWDDYTKAREAMFFHTDTADAPWTVIRVRCKSARASTRCATCCTSCPTRRRTSSRSARSIRCWSAARARDHAPARQRGLAVLAVDLLARPVRPVGGQGRSISPLSSSSVPPPPPS